MNSLLSAVFENVTGILFVILVDGAGDFRFESVNQAFLEATGLRKEQVVGRRVEEIIPQPSRAMVLGKYREAIRGRKTVRWEESSVYPAGTRHGEVSVTPVFEPGGASVRLVGIVHDVTAKKAAETILREQARLLDLIFQHTLDSIVLLDKDFNFVRVSRTYAQACRRPVSDFIGKNHFELYPSNLREEFEEARRTKAVYSKSARPFIFPDHPEWGTTYWDLGLVPILDAAGEIEYFLFTLKDVTVRVRAQAALAESEAKFSKAFHGNPVAMGIRRAADEVIVDANAGLERLLGCGRGEVAGKTMAELGFPVRRGPGRDALIAKVEAGEVRDVEVDFLRKDGEVRRVLLSADKISLNGVACYLASCFDITERRQAELALREVSQVAQERARQLQALAGSLVETEQRERRRLAALLHDNVQQLIVSAAMHVKLIAEGTKSAEETRSRAAAAGEILKETIKATRSLTYDLCPPVLFQAGLGPSLKWLAGQMRTMHALEVDVALGPEPVSLPESIRDFLFTSTRELLFNVVKHAGVERSTVSVSTEAGFLRVTVADAGAGFAAASRAEKEGLGLGGIRERLALFQGRMEIDSGPEKGSRVSLVVPLQE